MNMIRRCDIDNNKIIVIKDFPSNEERIDFWYHVNNCDYSYSQLCHSHTYHHAQL